MKKCPKCKEVKPFEEFHKNKSRKDGRQSRCKPCFLEYCQNRSRTLIGKAFQIFSRQKASSKFRGHQPPKYTRGEFVDWLLSNEDYIKLFDEWEKSGYEKSLAPSVDRIDDYKGYSFNNIKVVTWKENNRKVGSDMRNGINNKQSNAVIKMDLNGVKLEEYYSIRQAAREIGVPDANIVKVCKGKRKKAGGFKWKYADHT